MPARRIAVIGLGIIGSVWARHLHDDGHQLRTWNRSPKPESPGWCPDLAQAVREAEIVALVLADGPVTQAIVERILPHLHPGCVVVQHATIGVDETLALRDQIQAAGCHYLDMPFTGSKPAAEARQTVFFVGDDDGHLNAVEGDVYAGLSRARLAMGPVGKATAIKLAMNLCIAGTYQALSESLALARAAGIDDAAYWQVMDLNVARSGLVDLKGGKMSHGDWTPQFSIKHLHKDLGLALRLAQELDRHLPQTGLLVERYAERLRAGDGDLDFAAMLKGLDPVADSD